MTLNCGACNGDIGNSRRLEQIPNLFKCSTCGCYNRLPRRLHKDVVGFLAVCNPSEDEIIKTFEKYGDLPSRFAKYRMKTGKWWDIACGLGGLVKKAQDSGFNATGNDIRPEVVEAGNRIYGIELVIGHFEYLEIERESLDVISCYHGIEHTLAPMAIMLKAIEVLKPGGLIYLTHPDICKDEYAEKFCDKSSSVGGHSYEWTYESFKYFIEQFKELKVIDTVIGIPNLQSNVPPSQEWLLRKQ